MTNLLALPPIEVMAITWLQTQLGEHANVSTRIPARFDWTTTYTPHITANLLNGTSRDVALTDTLWAITIHTPDDLESIALANLTRALWVAWGNAEAGVYATRADVPHEYPDPDIPASIYQFLAQARFRTAPLTYPLKGVNDG